MNYLKFKFSYAILCYYFITIASAKDINNWRTKSNNNNIQRNNSSEILSRKKRFIFPAVSSWRFDLALTLIGYAEGYPDTTTLVGFIPFTWSLNTLGWVSLDLGKLISLFLLTGKWFLKNLFVILPRSECHGKGF